MAGEIPSIEQHRAVPDRLPVRGRPHLRFVPRRKLRLPETRRAPAQATPHFTDLFDDGLIAPHRRVPQGVARRRVGQQMPRRRCVLRRKFVEAFALASELEPKVREPSTQQDRRLLPLSIEGQLRRMTLRVLFDHVDRQLRAFDARPRDAEPIGEVAQRSRHRAPTAAHAGFRDTRFVTLGRLLLDHEIERHEAGQ